MIKDLIKQQNNSKNAYFARQLTVALHAIGIEPSPIEVTRAFNKHSKVAELKPHTVRKWLLGITQPRSKMLLLLAEWLHLEPQELLKDKKLSNAPSSMTGFEFDLKDQEVISKYLAMTVKQKYTVRLVIDAISENQK
ncbi:MAG: hypothetical protein WAO82_01255 [Limnohabitans sp.]